jgi:hypothetical protein
LEGIADFSNSDDAVAVCEFMKLANKPPASNRAFGGPSSIIPLGEKTSILSDFKALEALCVMCRVVLFIVALSSAV